MAHPQIIDVAISVDTKANDTEEFCCQLSKLYMMIKGNIDEFLINAVNTGGYTTMRLFKKSNRVSLNATCQYMVGTLAAIWLSCICVSTCIAQDPGAWSDEKSTILNSYIESLAEQKEFNGAVLIAENGDVVYETYRGFANINDKAKVLGPRSSFRLASVSKQFTAMAIMILKEQGKLEFDDDIRKHLPSLPYEGITIRHLLHHNGGVPDYTVWFSENWDNQTDIADRKTAYNKDVIEQFSKAKPEVEFQPGETHEYSNTGYVMLGQIIENASGVPIRQFFQEEIFAPLEMDDSQAFSPGDDFTVSERVYGFSILADGIAHEDNDWNFMNGMIGDGGIYSSARDMLKWDQAWYGDKLVSQKTISEAYVSGKTNDGEETGYGFGLLVSKDKDGQVTSVTHNGGWVGFVTHITRNLSDDRTVIVLTNNSGDGFGSVMRGLRQLSQGEELETPLKNVNYEMAAIIEAKGIDAAIKRFNEIEAANTKEFSITDGLIERLAKFYRDNGQSEIGEKLEQIVNSRPEIVLTKEQLKKFVGNYPLTADFVIKISQRDSQLFGQATGQGEFRLKPISENRFKVVEIDAEVSFNKNDDGDAESLTLFQGGAIQVAEKSDEPIED